MNPNNTRKPLLLMIIDGWGYREDADDNAISRARTPHWDRLWASSVHSLLDTSGKAVGLPAGQMGNSEVGHMNIGAGRVVYQDFTRIDEAIRDESFFDNSAMCSAVKAAVEQRGTLHIMGLLSPGGVHSHDGHFGAAVELARRQGAKTIRIHAFLDGRDTPPRSAMPSIELMQSSLDAVPGAAFGTITGRYYAMDRDQRWERVQLAWRAIVNADAPLHAATAASALLDAYARGENDEFVKPVVIRDYQGMKHGDAVLFVNFRADRARQLTQVFVQPDFDAFERKAPQLSAFVTMTEYQSGLPVEVAFPNENLREILGEVLARNGLHQLRIAETEKYAHVTFFLNGGREEPFPNEDRVLIPSPGVATYDLQPEMSAPALTESLVAAIKSQKHDVIICNVANPDMVGHSGNMQAAMQACEAVDTLIGKVDAALEAVGGELLITADHGNVEQMLDRQTGQVHTAHTVNPVPLVFRGRAVAGISNGTLRDIAPTMLSLLGLPQPAEMTGTPLLTLSDE